MEIIKTDTDSQSWGVDSPCMESVDYLLESTELLPSSCAQGHFHDSLNTVIYLLQSSDYYSGCQVIFCYATLLWILLIIIKKFFLSL